MSEQPLPLVLQPPAPGAPLVPVTSEHVTDGGPCWCDPAVETYEDGTRLVIHRREQ